MECKICNSSTTKLFEKVILNKYTIGYYQCSSCLFVQTEDPYWLQEAYNSAITSLDIGLLRRNNYLIKEIAPIIDCCFPEANTMLDFAGGYGAFVRLMRDEGYHFYRQDVYCENLFANHFDIKDIKQTHFDIVTGFEVLEHLNNPLKEIEDIFKYADTAIFSTDLLPNNISEIENWIYLAEETGQHISFFTSKAMELIANKFGKNYYCKNNHIHLFTPKKLNQEQIDFALKNKTKKRYLFGLIKKRIKKYRLKRVSLQEADLIFIKKILNK